MNQFFFVFLSCVSESSEFTLNDDLWQKNIIWHPNVKSVVERIFFQTQPSFLLFFFLLFCSPIEYI